MSPEGDDKRDGERRGIQIPGMKKREEGAPPPASDSAEPDSALPDGPPEVAGEAPPPGSSPSEEHPAGEDAGRDEAGTIPSSRLGRSARLGAAIGGQATKYAGTAAANLARSEEKAQERTETRHLEAALKMVSVLGEMKGAAMKIGQMASFIDIDFLPPEYREIYQEELARLRSQAPAMPWEKVREILVEEYEAQNQRAFARAYDGHPFIHVPKVHSRFSRRRVLVSEYVDGLPFEQVKELPQDERDIFGEIVFRFCFGSIYHLQHFNADTHPGNYLLMDDGRVAFLDFGMTKRLEPEQIVMEQRALDAAFRDDPGTLREALDEIGFLHDPEAIDAERLMEHVKFVGGWYMEDVELEITSERVMKMIEVTSDPRSDFYDLVRKEAVPADELMGRRMETGLLAVLAQLRATANWHRIMREWVYGDPAETVLGEADWRYFEQRGTSQTPGLTDRSRAG